MIRVSRALVSALVLSATLGCGAAPPPATNTVPPTPSAAPVSDDAAVRADGAKWAAAFYKGETQALWDRFDDGMKGAMKTKGALDEFRDLVTAQAGVETQVLSETVEHKGAIAVYLRDARFDKASMIIRMTIAFDANGAIGGFGVHPAPGQKPTEAATTKLDYQTKTALRLPFSGAWKVFWGGRTIALNQHAASRGQRFAYDLVIVRGGVTHAGDGTRNSDYFDYGQTIVAPGDGVVVSVVDGIAENVPGVMDPNHAPGNSVMIDHGDGEYSLLAHMIPGSLRVKEGDHVKAGQELGKCGNSGNSSEPHLHYHLQDAAKFGEGDGLPAQFLDYTADGKRVSRGEPTRGQIIEAATPTPARP